MPLSPSLARSFFLLSLIYELRDSSACSFFCKSKTAGSAGREKCWSLSLSLSPSLARDFDGRTQNEEARARSEKGKKTRAETKNFKEPRMDKREKAKALDAKAKKKSASSAASKDEKKKDKVREEENGRSDGKEEPTDAIGSSGGDDGWTPIPSLLSARAGDFAASFVASCGCAALVPSR